MDSTILAPLAATYRRTFDWTLELTTDLHEEYLRWQPSPKAPSIAFHIWHLARYADRLQETINGAGSQLWDVDAEALKTVPDASSDEARADRRWRSSSLTP